LKWCYRIPPHEVIHLIQRISNQTANTFSSEHDASFVALILLWNLSQEVHLKDLFIPGMAEAVTLSMANNCRSIWLSMDEHSHSLYQQWRSAFGMKEVQEWRDPTHGLLLESQFKSLVTVEGFCPNGDFRVPSQQVCKNALDLLFKNRTGKILEQKLIVPGDLSIAGDRIKVLTNPIPGPTWKNMLAELKIASHSNS